MQEGKRYFIGMTVFLAVGLFLLFHSTALASGSTYYVNNNPESNCSNAHAGTSEAEPWCDFTNINEMSLKAGDKVLLARGGVWDEQLTIQANGSANNKVTIGAYGTGERPKIIRSGSAFDIAMKITNPNHLHVSDLEVGNAGMGILVYFDTLGNEGLAFNNILAHDIRGIHQAQRHSPEDDPLRLHAEAHRVWNSAGLIVTGKAPAYSVDDYALKGLRIDNFEGTHNQGSIAFDWLNGGPGGVGTNGHNLVQDVVLNKLYLHDDNGPATGCDDTLRFINTMNVVVMNSIIDNGAGCHSPTGTAAVFFGRVQDIAFVNNILTNTPNTNSPDMAGIDYETQTNGVAIRNNLISGHAGKGVAILTIWGPSGYHSNIEISGNTFFDNGYGGSVSRMSNQGPAEGVIRDNIYFERAGFTSTANNGTFEGFTFINNREGVSSTSQSHAASQFGSIQHENGWSYQYQVGDEWVDLSYDSSNKAWKPTGKSLPTISQFEVQPDVDGAVARTWTADYDGTVSVRGRVLKADIGGGDGVIARITHNGEQIWPQTGTSHIAYNDMEGLETNVDDLVVSKGDVLRFEVSSGLNSNNEHDLTSWVPSIMYTSGGDGDGTTPMKVIYGDFEESSSEGWIAGSNTDNVQVVQHNTANSGFPSNAANGEYLLQAQRSAVRADEHSAVYKEFRQPLNMTGMEELNYSTFLWGGVALNSISTLKLYTAVDGVDDFYFEQSIPNSQWINLTVDLSDWEGLEAVTKIEIGFRNEDLVYTDPWDGFFHIDHVYAYGKDLVSPETTLHADGTKKNGWYSSEVTVQLTAMDALSEIASTLYSLDDGDTWIPYQEPITLEEGVHSIKYYSTDAVNNKEPIKEETIKIDKIAPQFSLRANDRILQDGDSFDDVYSLIFQVNDNTSGVAKAEVTIGDNTYEIEDLSNLSLEIDLAGKLGTYEVVVSLEDIAGNQKEITLNLSVTASIESMKTRVDHYYEDGKLDHPIYMKLKNSLKQVEHHRDKERPEIAAKHMRNFMKHLTNNEDGIDETVQEILFNNANYIHDKLLNS